MDAVTAELLAKLGLDPVLLHWRVREGLVAEDAPLLATEPVFSFGAHEALREARVEAEAQRVSTVEPWHIVIGLMRERGVAAEILSGLGVTAEKVRDTTRLAVVSAIRTLPGWQMSHERSGPLPAA